MKYPKLVLLLLIPCLCLMQCASHQPSNQTVQTSVAAPETTQPISVPKDSFPSGKIIPVIHCISAPYSYALFLPKDYDKQKKYPVILFFDPHGKGNLPLTKYSYLANEFNYILIGSNDSKNGLTGDETNQIAAALSSEALSRFPADEKSVTLAGFSGGAKVALESAMLNPQISQVIYSGAATGVASSLHIIPILGFAGVNDMNYTDLIAFNESMKGSKFPHFLIQWNGKHEWPDSLTFAEAFYFIAFNKMRALRAPDAKAISAFKSLEVHKLKNKDVLVQANALREMIFMLNGLADISTYQKILQQLETSAAYQSAQQKNSSELAAEGAAKNGYIDDFENQDLNWWKTEITRLQNDHDPQRTAMNQRLLGFISLACYSISNNAIQSHQFDMAEKVLAIYKQADPKNSDQPFFEACLAAQQAKTDEAIQSLQRAVQLGMRDSARTAAEPMLQSLQGNASFIQVLHEMNSSPFPQK